MKVTCITTFNDIDKFSFHQWVTAGEKYEVFGIKSYLDGTLHILVNSGSIEHLLPMWLPIGLFQVVENSISQKWFYNDCMTGEMSWLRAEKKVLFLLGYYELVSSTKHFQGIIERDFNELVKFTKIYDDWH